MIFTIHFGYPYFWKHPNSFVAIKTPLNLYLESFIPDYSNGSGRWVVGILLSSNEGYIYIYIYLVYKCYILPIGWLYATYHHLQEPETLVDSSLLPKIHSKFGSWRIIASWNFHPGRAKKQLTTGFGRIVLGSVSGGKAGEGAYLSSAPTRLPPTPGRSHETLGERPRDVLQMRVISDEALNQPPKKKKTNGLNLGAGNLKICFSLGRLNDMLITHGGGSVFSVHQNLGQTFVTCFTFARAVAGVFYRRHPRSLWWLSFTL